MESLKNMLLKRKLANQAKGAPGAHGWEHLSKRQEETRKEYL